MKTYGMDAPKIIMVIETASERGFGTKADPVRTVTQYWSFEGELLAELDPDAWLRERLRDLEIKKEIALRKEAEGDGTPTPTDMSAECHEPERRKRGLFKKKMDISMDKAMLIVDKEVQGYSKEFTDIKCLRNAVLDELDADVRMVRVEKKAPSKVGLDEGKAISAKSIMEYPLGITQEDVERIISVPMSLFNILICLNHAITMGLDDKKLNKEVYLTTSYGLVCAAEQIYSLLDENTKKEHEGCIKTLIISKEKLLRYYRNQP